MMTPKQKERIVLSCAILGISLMVLLIGLYLQDPLIYVPGIFVIAFCVIMIGHTIDQTK